MSSRGLSRSGVAVIALLVVGGAGFSGLFEPHRAANAAPTAATAYGSTAPSAAASASATASASASASESAVPPPKPIARAIPVEPSEAPKDEWASAETVWSHELTIGGGGWRTPRRLTCSVSMVREWLRVRCETPNATKEDKNDPTTLGAVGGVAGDLKEASARVDPLAKTMPDLDMANQTEWEQKMYRSTLGMGGRAEVVVPLRPGSSSLIEVGRLLWEFGYDSAFRVTETGVLLETSWAKGETSPRVLVGGLRVLE